MPDKLIALLLQSWADLDWAVAGLGPESATARHGGSSIAWTVGHVTNQVDAWLNVRFQALPPHPLIGDQAFRTGGSGAAEDWPSILAAVAEVHASARMFLNSRRAADLDQAIPYDGAIAYLRPAGLSLRHAGMRIAAHHFLHVGEIVTVRAYLGHPLADDREWGKALL